MADQDRILRRFMNSHFTVSGGGGDKAGTSPYSAYCYVQPSVWVAFVRKYVYFYFFGSEALLLLGARTLPIFIYWGWHLFELLSCGLAVFYPTKLALRGTHSRDTLQV